jgi:threonine dehydratase
MTHSDADKPSDWAALIEQARTRIAGHVWCTPLVRARSIGANVLLKMESEQITGR